MEDPLSNIKQEEVSFDVHEEIIFEIKKEDTFDVNEENSNKEEYVRCFFCRKENSDGKTKLFTEETLKRCQNVLKARQKHNLKYKDISNECIEGGYHSHCYKVFTSIGKKYYSREPETFEENCAKEDLLIAPEWGMKPSHSQSSTTESPTILQQATQSIKNQHVCIICSKKTKKIRQKMDRMHEVDINQFKYSLRPYIEDLDQHTDLLDRLDNFSGSTVLYHKRCKLDLVYKISSSKAPKTDWGYRRDYNQLAFNEISSMIEEDVIKNGRCYLLVYLHDMYVGLLENFAANSAFQIDSTITEYYLEERILKTFSKHIKFLTVCKKKAIAPIYLEAIDSTEFENLQTEYFLQKAALILRKSIMQLEKKKLPTKNITAQDLLVGEVSIPQDLLKFYYILLGGNEKRNKKCTRQVHSFSQDVIFAVQNGQARTSKHIMLGMTLKSITSDRRIIDIINRYGHCISYQDVKEIEAEKSYTSVAEFSLCPEKVKKQPDLFTGVAYDNVDRIIETASGKNMLHDTVGIIYQNIDSSATGEISEVLAIDLAIEPDLPFLLAMPEEVYIPREPEMPIERQMIIDPEILMGSDMLVKPNMPLEPDTLTESDMLINPFIPIGPNMPIEPDMPKNTEDFKQQTPNIGIISTKNKETKRTCEAISTEDISNPKKTKMINQQLMFNDMEMILSPNWQLYSEIDNIWMISHALELPDVPMWVGFNSQNNTYNNDSPQQQISFLTPNASTTFQHKTTTVLETMEQTKKIAEYLHQPYIQVTYNLSFAKEAYQIQAAEKPKYDNLFIHLGSFHIMVAYFKALGKVITDCGLTNVMVESGLLTNGSLNGFLDGKHFERCKRLHPLVALGLEILHFKSFLQNNNIMLTKNMKEEVKRLQTCKISSFEIENEELKELICNYKFYKQQCLNGEHGKTSQFYLMYINLIHHYLNLSRSIRTGNFELFIFILPKITNLFFMCNLHDYAQWTVKYHEYLLKFAETHPDLYKGFIQGWFGIGRTNKPFSRQPIDLILEQTKKTAAKRLTDILYYTNSTSAHEQCAQDHVVKSTVISQVYLELGLQTQEDVSAELNLHNIRKNTQQLHQFVATFERFINPFSSLVPKDQLINISTGRSASPPVEAFLLNIEENGDRHRKTFISQCSSDINGFEKAIKKTSIDNFTKDQEKKVVLMGDDNIKKIKMQRDLFGRTLGISMDHNVDIAKTLSYPITPMPLSMCHLDGTICKTDKSALMECLENEVQHVQPQHIDVFIIDGLLLLQTMKNVPKTFGSISKKMLQTVTQLPASRIDVIFGQHLTPSVKDSQRRLEYPQLEYTISGPDHVRPDDFAKELKNPNFIEALVEFFISHWATNEMVPLISNKFININFRKCHSFAVNDSNEVESSVDENLSCPEHENADTKIVFHACNIEYDVNIAIRSVGSDVAAIMLSHMHDIKGGSRVWMRTGTGNPSKYVDLTEIHAKLGNSFCQSLPGLHALTGCDYNPAFFKTRKSKAYKTLKQHEEYQEAFIMFGGLLIEDMVEQQKVFGVIQRFICNIYDTGDMNDVDDARLKIFINSCKDCVNGSLDQKKLRKFDASNLPPCKTEMFQQFLRSNYICIIWNNAHLKSPTFFKPESNGWILENGQYHFKWFEGDQLPNDFCYFLESLDTLSETNEDDIDDDLTIDWSSDEDNEDIA